MVCVLCDADGVSVQHYGRIHGFRLTEHFVVNSATATNPTSYSCRACRPERVVKFSPGDAVLHCDTAHEPIVVGIPEREVPEPGEPALTWALFNRWAHAFVELQDERDELVAEVESLRSSTRLLTRTVEEQRGKLNERIGKEVTAEFRSVYEDIASR